MVSPRRQIPASSLSLALAHPPESSLEFLRSSIVEHKLDPTVARAAASPSACPRHSRRQSMPPTSPSTPPRHAAPGIPLPRAQGPRERRVHPRPKNAIHRRLSVRAMPSFQDAEDVAVTTSGLAPSPSLRSSYLASSTSRARLRLRPRPFPLPLPAVVPRPSGCAARPHRRRPSAPAAQLPPVADLLRPGQAVRVLLYDRLRQTTLRPEAVFRQSVVSHVRFRLPTGAWTRTSFFSVSFPTIRLLRRRLR